MLNAPLPSGLVPSPSIQTLATATADYSPQRKATHMPSCTVLSTTHALAVRDCYYVFGLYVTIMFSFHLVA